MKESNSMKKRFELKDVFLILIIIIAIVAVVVTVVLNKPNKGRTEDDKTVVNNDSEDKEGDDSTQEPSSNPQDMKVGEYAEIDGFYVRLMAVKGVISEYDIYNDDEVPEYGNLILHAIFEVYNPYDYEQTNYLYCKGTADGSADEKDYGQIAIDSFCDFSTTPLEDLSANTRLYYAESARVKEDFNTVTYTFSSNWSDFDLVWNVSSQEIIYDQIDENVSLFANFPKNEMEETLPNQVVFNQNEQRKDTFLGAKKITKEKYDDEDELLLIVKLETSNLGNEKIWVEDELNSTNVYQDSKLLNIGYYSDKIDGLCSICDVGFLESGETIQYYMVYKLDGDSTNFIMLHKNNSTHQKIYEMGFSLGE